MQTFLPLPGFRDTARLLDWQRLCKQRSETLQILNALTNPEYGWQHHPAVQMWRGYEWALICYGVAICEEWIRRGYKDTCLMKILAFIDIVPVGDNPPWLGNEQFHRSHRSNLLRKNPQHYRQFWPEEDDGLEYVWPGRGMIGAEHFKKERNRE